MTITERAIARRGHAVVLGASMGGLLAARILSDSFEQVTVIERDDLSTPGDRRGVPQGRHVHALLARGRQVMEELFPGITDELLADGAMECRSLTQMRMTVAGHTLRRSDGGYSLLQASRPFLEWRVRNRVRALPNVELADRRAAVGLLVDADRTRVTGVRIMPEDATVARDVRADLVVSCLGRHGPVGDWLAALGYERPAEEGVRIDMMYASRYVRLPVGALSGDREIVIANQDPARGLALFAVEGGTHILTLIGYGKDHPPTDSEGFWRFAASVAPPDVREALLDAEPLTGISTYRYPANQRRRYERLSRFPLGLLVLGDAVCSFSPAFGQGMTVSALQAVALRRVLAKGDDDLAPRFFRAAARAIDDAWMITKLFDSAMPHVDAGGRSRMRALGALARLTMAVGAQDAVVARQIARIAGLLDSPGAVLNPALVVRAARGSAAAGVEKLRELGQVAAGSVGTEEFDPIPQGPARGFNRLAVRSIVPAGADSVLVEFDVPAQLAGRYAFAAGQHLVVRGTHAGQQIRRSYSLCDAAGSGRVRIGVKRRSGGAFSGYALDRLTVGTALHVSEPAGRFTPELDPARARTYAAVAAGSGITPIASIIATTLETEPDSTFTLHYGSRDSEHVMLADQLAALADRFAGRLRVIHHLSRQRPRAMPRDGAGVAYRHGRVAAAEIAEQDADQWFLCGPKELVAAVVSALGRRGVEKSRIMLELFETDAPVLSAPVANAPTSRVTLTGHGEDLLFEMARGPAILEAALRHRADLPYSCLGGSCGTCLATVESGQVTMDPDPLSALTEQEIARGRVLACRATPVSAEVTLRFGE
ncbi:2Fe-2S iron-sulfur cluster-binding protein [Nocardia abscessus]|uniref:2Fe-2S iron-sulfur cluster-binding protein n=1 Tax=Nocardia abscessus TaxID=120957 RepID=UPI0024540A08|nr:2Fe-2S iron-sulfur cluster-binding protein [Nocardia abscessus]